MNEPVALFETVAGQYSTTNPHPDVWRFQVIGQARPKGSTVAFGNSVVASNASALAQWSNAITDRAHTIVQSAPNGFPLDGPLALDAVFRFACPKNRVKRALQVGGTLPHAVAPDLDKLLRAVFDALQASGMVTNDARFTTVTAIKVELVDTWIGADLTVRRLG